jgi:hypothetical protein
LLKGSWLGTSMMSLNGALAEWKESVTLMMEEQTVAGSFGLEPLAFLRPWFWT